MPHYQPSLLARDDTFFGVCQGIGDDFGVHPNWLRAAFALALFWNPVGAVAAYAAAGIVVMASRLLVREPRTPMPEPAVEAEAVEANAAEERQPALPLAA